MSLTIDILKRFDEFGLEDVIEHYSKEAIEDAIKESTHDETKKQLKVLSSNWLQAEKVLGAIKKLAEIEIEEEEISFDEAFDSDWSEDDEEVISDWDDEDDF